MIGPISLGAVPISSRIMNGGRSRMRGFATTFRISSGCSFAVISISTPPASVKRMSGCLLDRSTVIER